MMKRQSSYREMLAAQLEQWDAAVNLYAAKADGAADAERMDFLEIAGALQRMQDEVRMKLHALQTAGGEEPADSQTDLDDGWKKAEAAGYGAALE